MVRNRYSHSDHCSVCTPDNDLRPTLEDFHWKTLSAALIFDVQSPFEFKICMIFFCRFWFCPPKHILQIYFTNCLGTWRFLSQIGSLWEQYKEKLKTKQTAVRSVIHIQPQLNYHVQNLARTPPHDIEIGHSCTGDVNAMTRDKKKSLFTVTHALFFISPYVLQCPIGYSAVVNRGHLTVPDCVWRRFFSHGIYVSSIIYLHLF